MLALLAAAAAYNNVPYPNTGIHNGANSVTWSVDCCDGDLVVLDFRDEQGDGNQGRGVLRLHNATSGLTSTYDIGPFWGLWKSFGPFCAPEGQHTMSFTSDANPTETTLTITDSFGLVRGAGGMSDFPITFNTTAPNKFCEPPEGLPHELQKARARKIFAFSLQGKPRAEIERLGWGEDNPFDMGFTCIDA